MDKRKTSERIIQILISKQNNITVHLLLHAEKKRDSVENSHHDCTYCTYYTSTIYTILYLGAGLAILKYIL